ncbi:unnamed protein product [Rhizophagus irregularis]|nr:unnamed protein product [Rhizophagus irregularis]
MADIKLTCLIRENLPEDAFETEIGKFDSVYYLKKIITEKIPKEFISNLLEDAFEIEIGKFDSVYYLKKIITEKIPKEFIDDIDLNIITDPRFLKLWKVNISINEKKSLSIGLIAIVQKTIH